MFKSILNKEDYDDDLIFESEKEFISKINMFGKIINMDNVHKYFVNNKLTYINIIKNNKKYKNIIKIIEIIKKLYIATGELLHYKLVILISLCGYRIPIQTDIGLGRFDDLIVDVKNKRMEAIEYKRDIELFRNKKDRSVRVAVKIRLDHLIEDVKAYDLESWLEFKKVLGYFKHAYNDTVCGWLMWFIGCNRDNIKLSRWCVSNWDDRDTLKTMTLMIKALGPAQNNWLSKFAETEVLIGKGIGDVDWADEIGFRTNRRRFMNEKSCDVDEEKLRLAIRRIMKEELDQKIVWPDKEEYWNKRFAWCKAGSHSKHIERHLYKDAISKEKETNRRMFLERVSENLIAYKDTKTFASISQKRNELGKVRSLYGCDTRNYVTFQYLLDPVEKAWNNKFCLLEPNGTFVSQRYSKLANEMGNVKLMLDYDDFNSQHTLRYQQICIEEVCRGAPEDVLNWCIESFDNMYIQKQYEEVKVVGTLMSGHRATSFINTILNRAYLIVTLGDTFDRFISYHAGDDVFSSTNDLNAIDEVFDKLDNSRIRMKPIKQAIGTVCGEFLRVSFNRNSAIGYFARSVGSTVAGNWENSRRLNRRELIDTYISNSWTLANRCMKYDFGKFLRTSAYHYVGGFTKYEIYKMLTHDVSVNRTPIRGDFRFTDHTSNIMVNNRVVEEKEKVDTYDNKFYATQDYIEKFVDIELLDELNIGVGVLSTIMKGATYARIQDEMTKVFNIEKGNFHFNSNSFIQWRTIGIRKVKGKLIRFLDILLIKNMLDKDDVIYILKKMGMDPTSDPLGEAFGREGSVCKTQQFVPYSDMRTLGSCIFSAHNIVVDYQVAV